MAPRYLSAALALAMTACGGMNDAADGSPGDGSEPDDALSGPGLRGLLLAPDGTPAPDVEVLACQRTTCLFGASGDDGRFDFTVEPVAEIALKTHPDQARNPRWAAALEPVTIVDNTLVDVGTVYIPDLPEGAVIGPDTEDPQTLDAGDGLELTLNRADLTAPIGEFLYDVSARLLPPEHIPTYAELDGEQVVAVYALHPFAATSTSPIGVRAPADLPDGSAVAFRTISELDGRFSEAVPGRADDGYVSTDPGTGIERLTYLVITTR